ncbi:MAG: CpXC domain-containing protein [Nitrososphaerales archaeon]
MTEPSQTAQRNMVPIQCPNCGNRFESPVISLIDVGAYPELRSYFLSGQLNVAVCPICKTPVMLEVPLVYHDPKAEFLAVYFPQQLTIPELEKQKMIGEVTQSLMRSLPPEQRKGYFLNPRQFVSRQNLADAIYGTMGISQEELDRQRKKAKLVEQLQVFADDPKGLQMMVKNSDKDIDGEFFAILATMLEQASATGDEKTKGRLEALRDNLMPITTWGKRAQKQRAAVEALKDVKTPEELVDRIVAADEDELAAIVLAIRPALDYRFFETLTGRVDAAKGAEKERLAGLRDRLLELTKQLDDAARESVESSVKLLQELINSPSPRTAVREHADEIDDMFMSVLTRNMQAAEQKGDKTLLSRLAMVYEEVMNLMQASAPPEVQFINELVMAPYPDGTRQLLQENREVVTPELLDLIGEMADQMAQEEGEDATEMVKRLRDIRAQAQLMI